MSTSNKWILGIIVLAVIVWAGMSMSDSKQKFSDEVIKIGVVGPLSGPSAVFGEYMNRGIELAMADLDPQVRDRIVIVREDDTCTGPNAISAVNKLIQIEGVKYTIGPLCNAATVATEKIYDDSGVISLTSGVPSKQIADMGPNHFSFSPEIENLMKTLAEYMRGESLARVGVLYVTDAFGQENLDQFTKHFESNGAQVVLAEGVEKGAMDLRTSILKIKSANPDSILVMLTGGSAVNALKEITVQGLGDIPTFGVHGIQSADTLTGAGADAEGVIYPYPASDVSTEVSEEYEADYLAEYQQMTELYSMNVYDSLTVLVGAIQECGYADTLCVQETIAKTRGHKGASGVITLDERGVSTFQKALLKIIRDGKFQKLEQ